MKMYVSVKIRYLDQCLPEDWNNANPDENGEGYCWLEADETICSCVAARIMEYGNVENIRLDEVRTMIGTLICSTHFKALIHASDTKAILDFKLYF